MRDLSDNLLDMADSIDHAVDVCKGADAADFVVCDVLAV
jgi:hypothetical protein